MLRIMGAVLFLATIGGCSKANEPTPANEPAIATQTGLPGDTTPLAIAATDPSLTWGPCPPVFATPGCEIAILHGDPARANADLLLRIPGGYVIPPHRHTSAERMILVSGAMRVRYQGNRPATLAAGHYAFGPAGLAHDGACLGDQPCTLFIAFEGPVDAEAVAEPLG